MTGHTLASLADVEPGRPVIVGGGVAGLSVALAATVPVTLFMPDGGESTCTRRAQGGITVESIAAVAESGVDVISSGWITHSAPCLDIGLDAT